jgi:hypothetical protein
VPSPRRTTVIGDIGGVITPGIVDTVARDYTVFERGI